MAWTTPRTWTTGELVTAAIMNSAVRDNENLLATSIETSSGKLSGNIKNFYEDVGALSISSNVLTIDLNAQNVINVTFSANITTTTLQNIPASGKSASIEIYLKANGSAFTWAWLTSTVIWDSGVAPTFVTTNNHFMRFLVSTIDGGTTWRGVLISSNYAS